MLLNDVRILENIEILSESKSPQGMCIRGLFQRADEENNNHRVYPKTVLESQVKSLQDMINENRLCGELDHPSHDIVKLSNASHLITGLYMEGNDVIGEAKVLDTPAGKVAQALIEGGVKIGISSRGVGTLSEDTMRKVKFVNEDYKLVTFDLVADPSTKGAFPALSESTESGEKTRKIVNDTYKKALGEKVFVTMLKESFDTSLQEADKPYGSDKSSYDEVMKMRGYPSVEEVMSRGNVKADPFYQAMMAAVKGSTPVKSNEGSKKKKAVRRGNNNDDDRRPTDIDDPAYIVRHGRSGRRQDDSTKPTYSKMAEFLSEAILNEIDAEAMIGKLQQARTARTGAARYHRTTYKQAQRQAKGPGRFKRGLQKLGLARKSTAPAKPTTAQLASKKKRAETATRSGDYAQSKATQLIKRLRARQRNLPGGEVIPAGGQSADKPGTHTMPVNPDTGRRQKVMDPAIPKHYEPGAGEVIGAHLDKAAKRRKRKRDQQQQQQNP